MARGGKRQGDPAKAGQYSNRSDLRTTQPIATAPGQPYGEATAQANAQRAMPLQNGAGVSVAPGAQAPGGQPQLPMPGAHGDLFAPTDNPNEPVTAGAASGPGAGPEALGMTPQIETPAVAALRAAYLAYPDEGLRDLIESLGT